LLTKDEVLPESTQARRKARGNILVGPQTFLWGLSGEKVFEFFFSKWYILAYFIFLVDGGAPKRRGARGSSHPTPPSRRA